MPVPPRVLLSSADTPHPVPGGALWQDSCCFSRRIGALGRTLSVCRAGPPRCWARPLSFCWGRCTVGFGRPAWREIVRGQCAVHLACLFGARAAGISKLLLPAPQANGGGGAAEGLMQIQLPESRQPPSGTGSARPTSVPTSLEPAGTPAQRTHDPSHLALPLCVPVFPCVCACAFVCVCAC
jgi:hypothetical protein